MIRTSRLPASPDVDSAIAQDALTEISGVIADLRADPQLISSLLKEGDCGELFKKLPQECRIGPEGEELTSALPLATYLARAEAILCAALRGTEAAS